MSRYLLDTNVLSETVKPTPDAGVVAFLTDLSEAFISVLSVHEIAYGLGLLPEGARRAALSEAVDRLFATFADAILPIREPEARAAGAARAAARIAGRNLDTADGLILGTALVNGLTVVTRNEKDVGGLGVATLNPWTGR